MWLKKATLYKLKEKYINNMQPYPKQTHVTMCTFSTDQKRTSTNTDLPQSPSQPKNIIGFGFFMFSVSL